MKLLEGKTAAITGGGGGLSRCYGLALARAGAAVHGLRATWILVPIAAGLLAATDVRSETVLRLELTPRDLSTSRKSRR